MKLVFLLSALAVVATAARLPRQAEQTGNGVDIAGGFLSQFGAVTRQIAGLQSVLGELNGQVSRMIASGTRLVTGLAAEGQLPGGVDSGLAGSLIGSFSQVTNQLSSVQRAITDITQNFQRIVSTSSRLIGGSGGSALLADAPTDSSPTDSALQALSQVTQQFASMQRVLGDISSQLSRMVATGSRLVSGQASEQTGNNPFGPAEAALQTLNQMTAQFAGVQRVLGDLSGQLNRMIETGSRLVSGQSAEGIATPLDGALQALSQVTAQVQGFQRVLGDLSGQLNRMIASSSRLVSGQESGEGIGSPASSVFSALAGFTSQFQGLQRVLGDMSAQINRMVATGSRLVSGQTSETGSGPFGPTDSALQALNQVTQQFASMQRVLGDLSGQLNRMITTGSRLVSGQTSEEQTQNPFAPTDAILSSLNQVTAQFQGFQRVLGDLSGQLNRMIASSSRLVSGQTSEQTSSPFAPAEAALQTLNQMTAQFAGVQRVLGDLSGQLNRMITTGSRLVAGQSSSEGGPLSAGDQVLQALTQVTSQVQGFQRVLGDLSGQLNRMISSSSRLVTGQTSESQTGSPFAPTDAALQAFNQITAQMQGFQRVLGDMSGQLNRMIATGSRLVSGQTSEPTGNGPFGPAEAALQTLNQMTTQFAGVQRVLGDLSGQLNRMIETGSRLVSG